MRLPQKRRDGKYYEADAIKYVGGRVFVRYLGSSEIFELPVVNIT